MRFVVDWTSPSRKCIHSIVGRCHRPRGYLALSLRVARYITHPPPQFCASAPPAWLQLHCWPLPSAHCFSSRYGALYNVFSSIPSPLFLALRSQPRRHCMNSTGMPSAVENCSSDGKRCIRNTVMVYLPKKTSHTDRRERSNRSPRPQRSPHLRSDILGCSLQQHKQVGQIRSLLLLRCWNQHRWECVT